MYKKIYNKIAVKKDSTGGRLLTIGLAVSAGAVAFAAPPPYPTTLESQAGDEFAAAGIGTRERFFHEAAGDLIGAQVAARDAEAHRRRYLDLEHEIERLRSPPVAASRDPFVPDASFGTPTPAFFVRGMPVTSVLGNISRVTSAPWDLYERRRVTRLDGKDSEESQSHLPTFVLEAPHRTAGDMYSPRTPRSPGSTNESRLASSAPEAPRQPLRVYQELSAGDDPFE